MSPWRESLLAFTALPEVGPLLLAAAPAWIWSLDGSHVVWANPSGARRLGADRFARLAERRWAEGDPLRRSLESLGRSLSGKDTLARLRLGSDAGGIPASCRCRLVRTAHARGTLILATGVPGESPGLALLAAYFTDAGAGAVILDATGSVLEEGAPGLSSRITPATPNAGLAYVARPIRLFLLDRSGSVATTAAVADAEARPESPVADTEISGDAPPSAAEVPFLAAEAAEEPPPDDREAAAPILDAAAPPEESKDGREEMPPERVVSAGRVERKLSRQAVRFLWQTDAAGRVLFVSPGLGQVVGRNSEIVGERWQDASARLRLDPTGRIAQSLARRDTWSGLTAWWPVEGSNVRVPAELTALPVFGGDQTFQGFRGFGVLKPAEALMPGAFEARFGAADGRPAPAEQSPSYEESAGANVVPIRADLERLGENARLTPQERNAFEEIAAALKDRVLAPRESGRAKPVRKEPEATPEDQEVRATLEDAADAGGRPSEERDVAEKAAAPPPPDPAPPPLPTVATPQAPHEEPRPPHTEPAAEAQLRVRLSEAERRLHEMTAILDTATDGVLILNAEGLIESVNASAEALFGLDAQDLVGTPFGDLLTVESRALALDYLSGLDESGVASLLNEGRELEARAGAGTIPLFMTMGRLSGEPDGRFCAVLRDITHWKRTESELTAAKRAAEAASNQKSEFLARVSHEVRTPLNAIIGFSEVMIEERFGPVENERYREYLRDIRTSGEHVVSLVNDLLDISKIEAGKLDLDFTAVPLNELVRESIGLMQPQANRARVVLRSSLSAEVPAIVADQRTLRQIVLNLLSNSVKFTSPGGQVIASTRLAETGEAMLRIRDTGEGMSEEDLVRALEPFRQLATATMAGKGTGLGLPLTKALVEANRARMTIRSARGEGTVVTVTFPPTRVLSE